MARKLPFLDDTDDDTGLSLGRNLGNRRAANVTADFPRLPNGNIPMTQVVRQSRAARLGAVRMMPVSEGFANADLLDEPARRLPMAAPGLDTRYPPSESPGNAVVPYSDLPPGSYRRGRPNADIPARGPFAGQRDISVRGPHSARFQESIDRSRALRSFSAGTAADMRSRGMNDRAAAQRAFAATHLLDADMQTGNGILERGMAIDQNQRANDVTASSVNAQGANAWAQDENTRTGMAMRGPMVQGMNLQNQGQDLQNEYGRRRLPFAGPDAAADVAMKNAQGQAAAMNSPFYARQMADLQRQHAELQKRNQQLEEERAAIYGRMQTENTGLRKEQAKNPFAGEGDDDKATPPAAGTADGRPLATLDPGTAKRFLAEAGGDKERARALARSRGYTF